MEQTAAHALDALPRTPVHRFRLCDFASVSHVLGRVAVAAAMAAR
jgi:hypothetical protein